MSINFKDSLVDGKLTYGFDGDLDMVEAPFVKGEILKKVAEVDFSELIMDFEKLNFIDSSGIGMLFFLQKQLVKDNKTISVVNTPDGIAQILKLSSLDKLISVS